MFCRFAEPTTVSLGSDPMSEVYNSESQVVEHIQALELEARSLATKRDTAPQATDRHIFERLLAEVERRVLRLREHLRRKTR